jgi:hypothetical protein
VLEASEVLEPAPAGCNLGEHGAAAVAQGAVFDGLNGSCVGQGAANAVASDGATSGAHDGGNELDPLLAEYEAFKQVGSPFGGTVYVPAYGDRGLTLMAAL